MILKIMVGEGFKIYGPFHELKFSLVSNDDAVALIRETDPGEAPDGLPIELVGPDTFLGEIRPVKVKQVVLSDMYGETFKVIRFFSAGYICNDNARTIERI